MASNQKQTKTRKKRAPKPKNNLKSKTKTTKHSMVGIDGVQYKVPTTPATTRKSKSDGKFDKPTTGPWSVTKKDLRHVRCYDAKYNGRMEPVCPYCGQFNTRPLDYGKTQSSKAHLGTMYFINICLTPGCRTIFRYYTTPHF